MADMKKKFTVECPNCEHEFDVELICYKGPCPNCKAPIQGCAG